MKNFKDITVAVAGTGYVGLSIVTLWSQHHHAPAVDVTPVEGELMKIPVPSLNYDMMRLMRS